MIKTEGIDVNHLPAELSKIDEDQDIDLIEKSKTGDNEAFGKLVRQYQNELFGLTLGLVSSYHEAQDLTAETFVKAWQNIKGFRQDSSFKTWLWRISINLCRSHLRRRYIAKKIFFWKNETFDDNRDRWEQMPDLSPLNDPQKEFEGKSLKDAIALCKGKLSGREKEVFTLKYDQNLKISEISSLLSLSQNTVKVLLFRAAKKMAKGLKDYQ